MITKEDFLKVKTAPEFKEFEVKQNNRGTIQITVSERGTNYYDYENKNRYGIQYQIGYSEDRREYWIRRRNGRDITPLHYNRHTHDYGFETFDDAVEYLKKLFTKHAQKGGPLARIFKDVVMEAIFDDKISFHYTDGYGVRRLRGLNLMYVESWTLKDGILTVIPKGGR